MIKLTPSEFSLFAKYVFDISGISLAKGKEYLLETRLNPLLEELGCKSYNDLYLTAKKDVGKRIEKKIIDAISTNETYFFRDNSPFELLQFKLLPDLIDMKTSGNKSRLPVPLRIWSAASSTGQEIYSIAMVIKDLGLDLRRFSIKLVGTDISDAAISKASYGKYTRFEISRGLNQTKLQKYFKKEGEDYRIKDEIRAMASFRKMNLMQQFVGIGKFDIVFCRNVAIYFTPVDRKKLYKKIADVMEPHGILLIGSTESLVNDAPMFAPQRYLKSVFYQIKK